jgi:hypothetical protein
MRQLRVGDVIASPGGSWRVVRVVHRSPNGNLWGVTLTIKHCSWTGRCYTVLCANDLRQRGFYRVPVKRRRLRSAFDQKIRQAIERNEHPKHGRYSVTCCDVEGVA